MDYWLCTAVYLGSKRNEASARASTAHQIAKFQFAAMFCHFFASPLFTNQMRILINYVLLIIELSHAILHCQVLFGIGFVSTEDDYKQKRNYFVFDAASPLVVLTWLWINSASIPFMGITLILGHFLLHLYFIWHWNRPNRAVRSIIKFSSEKNQWKRISQRGVFEYCVNFFGTSYDILTHLWIVWRLYLCE